MTQRPQRTRIRNEFEKLQTLLGGESQFQRLSGGPDVVILGTGPEPAELAHVVGAGRAVYVIEAPQFKAQMPASWGEAIPGHWQFIDPEDLDDELAARSEVWIYQPAVRLFPSFWAPITGKVRLLKSQGMAPASGGNSVILPASHDGLLTRELREALEKQSFAVREVAPQSIGRDLPAMLRDERPALFLSVNFRGLDPHGEVFHLLHAAGVPVCAWCVDNPFHLISGLRSPFWRQTHLAVTDAWFINPLAKHGAQSVFHMPLATSPAIFAGATANIPDLAKRMAFVGRSAFPGRGSFFAACKVPQWQAEAAEMLVAEGGRPDYAWWLERLDIWPLWPDLDARRVGLGAENAGRERRFACVQAAASELPLTIYGDEGWRDALPPEAELRAPVDYYNGLAGVYRSAAWTLNVTSLLLPRGLTQRHFDVWAAGGFLITDDTPGLDIFPAELAREISFSKAADIAPLARRLMPGSSLRSDLAEAWTSHILTHHTYDVRVADLVDRFGSGSQ